jgi:hypothetical protein
LLLLLPALAGATEYTGKVISVHDGDISRVHHNGELKFRLECIDGLRSLPVDVRRALPEAYQAVLQAGIRRPL